MFWTYTLYHIDFSQERGTLSEIQIHEIHVWLRKGVSHKPKKLDSSMCSYHSKTSIQLFNFSTQGYSTYNQHTQATYSTNILILKHTEPSSNPTFNPSKQIQKKYGTSTGGGTFGGSGARSNVLGLHRETHGEIDLFMGGVPCLYGYAQNIPSLKLTATNIAPENRPSQKETIRFQVLC